MNSQTPISDTNLIMQLFLVIWIITIIWICKRNSNNTTVGLPAAFVLCMTFLYGGCFVYAVPGYTHLRPDGHWYLKSYSFNEIHVINGTMLAVLALIAFGIGTKLKKSIRTSAQRTIPPRKNHDNKFVPILFLLATCLMIVGLMRLSFPFSGALFEFGRNLLTATICLSAFQLIHKGRNLHYLYIIILIVPIYYVFFYGLASYSILFISALFCFWMSVIRRTQNRTNPLAFTAIFLLGGYLSISAAINWLGMRDDLRGILWYGSEGSAFELVLNALAGFKFFSPADFDSLDVVNIRLNLPLFIGKMMEKHELDPGLRLWGSTLMLLPLIFLPRFLWAGKPERGGSEFMSEHTGIPLGENVTFGSGTVFELYANFQFAGVFLGFVLLGWLVRLVDQNAAAALKTGRSLEFVKWLTIGLVPLDPLLRPFFILNGMTFAWIFVWIIIHLIGRTRDRAVV